MQSNVRNPKISIIMPMYGVELYIEKAIRSVIDQDFQDWELLVVNDGTLDRSRDIANMLASTDSRIQILDKENGGLSDARNFGLDNARGEFVHFYDSDDWIDQDFYSSLIKEIENYDLLVCGYKVDYEHSIVEKIGYRGELHEVVGTSLHHFVGTYLNFAWNKLFKRSFLVQNSLFFEKGLYRIEDSEFIMRYIGHTPKIKFSNYAGYHYVVRNTTTLSSVYDETIIEHTARSIDIHKHIFEFICGDDNVIRTELGKMNYFAIKSLLYRLKSNMIPKNIIQCKNLIDKIVNYKELYIYIDSYVPVTIIEYLFIKAIKHKWSRLLMMMLKFN